jgi:hypothetical protein
VKSINRSPVMAGSRALGFLWLLLALPAHGLAHGAATMRTSPRAFPRPPAQAARPLKMALFERAARDLRRDDWQPLETSPAWLNPCFFTCTITAASVVQAWHLGLFPVFGIGPLCVLLSSLAHWSKPLRNSRRRTADLVTTRIGMSSQVLLAVLYCYRGLIPTTGVAVLLAGYAAALPCYAVGRVLTVRGHRLLGAWVHGGLHLFSNIGNLVMLSMVQ